MLEHRIHYIRFLLRSELNALYTSVVLRDLAFSMVGIFVPLYLFIELKYSLSHLILFYLIYSISYGLFVIPSSKLVDIFSFKYITLISSPIYISYFILLDLIPSYTWLFYLAPFLLGIADSFFWLGFHFEFSEASDYKERGKEVGNWFNLSLFSGLIGPLIGGGLLLASGFDLLFFIVAALIFGSSVPMFFCKYKNKRMMVKFKEIFNIKFLKDGIAYFGNGGVGVVGGIFWPIFVFSFLNGYLKLGGLATIVSIFTLLFTFIIGKISDRYDRRLIVKIGSIFNCASWVLKLFIRNMLHLVGLYLFGGFSSMTAELPFSALMYDKSKNRGEYFIMRGIYYSLGRIGILLLVLWIGNLESSFFLAGMFSLLYMFL
ncbi:MFS transporter [Candidatus Woesearchaeota archaeon]|nr:MFS transporter [Candidatus Woesearchaeota archaeon]